MNRDACPQIKDDIAKIECRNLHECSEACKDAGGKLVIIYIDDPKLLVTANESLPSNCVIALLARHRRLDGKMKKY